MSQKFDADKVIGLWMDRDLTALAEAGALPPTVGLEPELDKIAMLVRSGYSPVLVGDSGVGKTAVVQALARRLRADPRWLPELAGRRVLELSLKRAASGPGRRRGEDRNEAAARLSERLARALAMRREQVIPFIRDFHLVYSYDVESCFSALPERAGVTVLAEGDRRMIQRMFEYEVEFERSFVILPLSEPRLEAVTRIVQAWNESFSVGGKRFDAAALDMAVELAHRFVSRDRMPRKAINLIRQVQSLSPAGRDIGAADVMRRFCELYHVPRMVVDPAIQLDLDEVRRSFSDKVLGQARAIDAVVRVIGVIKAGLTDPRRPFGAFLFTGPTGVGKTEVAKVLAGFLFDGPDRVIRINMADYALEGSASILFGASTSDSLARRRGDLATRVAGEPFAVLLLDEFEKAHAEVHDRMLQLIDEGCFINGAGELVSCRSMIIIATTNAGAEVYRGQSFGFVRPESVADRDAEIDRRLEQRFRLEFLNRFDEVVHFHPLSRETIREIARRELGALRQRSGLRYLKLNFEVDDDVLDWLATNGFDPDYGARFLRRTIERHAATAIAEVLVKAPGGTEGNGLTGATIGLSVRQGRVVARLVLPPPATPPVRRAAVALPRGAAVQVRELNWRALEEQARRLRDAAAPLAVQLEQRRERCSHLLEQMNDAALWTDAQRRQPLLDEFRTADLTVRALERVVTPALALDEWLSKRAAAADRPRWLPAFAQAVEQAARALQDWELRLAEEQVGGAWLIVSSVDVLAPVSRWIEDLVRMELSWCERLGLAARLAGCDVRDGQLVQAALEVEGPGTLPYLTPEVGLHRFVYRGSRGMRARVELAPRSAHSLTHAKGAVRMLPRPQDAPLGLRATCCGRLEIETRGLVIDWLSDRAETLAHLMADLKDCWQTAPVDSPDTARIYNEDGGGGRDPRTGAALGDLRQVLSGELHVFLDGWRQAGREASLAGESTSSSRP